MFNVDLSKVDLSKVLPDRAYELLAGFAPGLFFLFSVLFANPDLIARAVGGAQQQFSIGRYALVAIGLFLAFIVGNAFMLMSTLLQYVFGILYPAKMLILRGFCRWPLLPLTERLMKKLQDAGANQAKKRDLSFFIQLLAPFNARIVTAAHMGFNDWRSIQQCWYVLARRLLKVRYGINERDLQGSEWTALFFNLGTWMPEDVRGNMMMIVLHATGWAGLAATRFAPRLHNKYYFLFCLFLILNGLLHDYYVVMRRADPRVAGYANIRAVLREFPKATPESKPAVNPREPTPDEL